MNRRKDKNGMEIREFMIGSVGVESVEANTLKRLFLITSVRNRDYKLKVITHPHDLQDIDIVLINESSSEALSFLRKNIGKYPAIANRPAIKLASKPSTDREDYIITKPFNPIRVLKLLDSYTIKELNYFPEFEIGNEEDNDQNKKITQEGIRILRGKNTASLTATNQSSIKALIVDDSLAVRKQLSMEFSLLNAEIETADNGISAISVVNQHSFDIIFLDVVMEGEDGYGVCKRIKKSGLNKNTPVILLTSKSSRFDKLKGTLAGCDSYLTKPINHIEFTEITEKFLKSNNKEMRHVAQ